MHSSPSPSSRRAFLRAGGFLTATLALGKAPVLLAAESPSRRVRVGVMGLGRGRDHVTALLQVPGVEVAWLCDVDERRLAPVVKAVADKTGREPRTTRDFRRMLEDPELDAVSIATPNFWHAPATILACAAGKHVYVEKPGSHNPQEAAWMVEAARTHRRRVQMGNQRRSLPEVQEAIQRLREGEIGPVRSARCWYSAARAGIGRGRPAAVPSWLDYPLWQGPLPERPYVDNLIHYNWHWRWFWGGGELANNGIHTLDLARWGLGVGHPTRVAAVGGRYAFDDDQETPDTLVATYDFGHCAAVWDGSSCSPRNGEKLPLVTFYGDKGSLSIDSRSGYRVQDPEGKETRSVPGRFGDVPHFSNFIAAIRDEAALNSEIAEGQLSTQLCHLGNIAWRTRSELRVDPRSGRIVDATRAMRRLWSRDYRPGWTPRV